MKWHRCRSAPLLMAIVMAILLSMLSGCLQTAVRLEIDATGLDDGDLDDASLRAVVYADDGGGCNAQRFVATPSLTPVSVAVVPRDALSVPRIGAKIVVVDAIVDGVAIARDCADLGEVAPGNTATVRLKLQPTTRIVDTPDATPRFGVGPGLVVRVADAKGDTRSGFQVEVSARNGGDVDVTQELTSSGNGLLEVTLTTGATGPVRVVLAPERPVDNDAVASFDGYLEPNGLIFPAPVGSDVAPVVIEGRGAFVIVESGINDDDDDDDDDDGAPGEAFVEARLQRLDSATATRILRLPRPPPPSEGGALRFLGAFFHKGLGGADVDDTFLYFALDDDLLVVSAGSPAASNLPLDRIPLGRDNLRRAVSVGRCDGVLDDADRGPALLVGTNGSLFVDILFGRITTATTPTPVASVLATGCVLRVDESRRAPTSAATLDRVLFVGDDVPVGITSIGTGLPSLREAAEAKPRPLILDDGAIQFSTRADGRLLIGRIDGGTVLVSFNGILGDDVVGLADVEPQRLPTAPLVLQQGAFFGNDDDILAVLDLATEADEGATALFGISGDVVSGTDAICRPARRCLQTRVVDDDGDGVLEVLTAFETRDGIDARAFGPPRPGP